MKAKGRANLGGAATSLYHLARESGEVVAGIRTDLVEAGLAEDSFESLTPVLGVVSACVGAYLGVGVSDAAIRRIARDVAESLSAVPGAGTPDGEGYGDARDRYAWIQLVSVADRRTADYLSLVERLLFVALCELEAACRPAATAAVADRLVSILSDALTRPAVCVSSS